MADLLKSHGWEVIERTNLSFVQLHDAVAEFEGKANGASVALVYYAGHGMSHQNRDFVAPTDMPEYCASDVLKRIIPLDLFFQAVEGAQRKIVLLDACRNQALPNCAKRGSEGGFRGLARVQSSGLLIASATAPGALSDDGAPGRHSPFARVLLDHFRANPSAHLHELLFKVAADVHLATRKSQTPELVVRGIVPKVCLSADSCGPLASAPEDVVKMRKETAAERLRARKEVEELRRRLKEEEEKADRQRRKAEDEARRIREEAAEAERLRKEEEEKMEEIRREREEERRRRHDLEPAPPPIPPPAASCGWFAIAYCSQNWGAAHAQTGRFGGFVINTSNYARFRAGWFCVVQGPMARDAAASAVRRMKAAGAGTAYMKNSC